MPFYKKQGQALLSAPNFVHSPTYQLEADKKDTYTYPVNGWYWFDTLDEAMAGMKPVSTVVTRRQFKLALLQEGLLDVVESLISTSTDRSLKISYDDALDFDINNPMVVSLATTMGKTKEDLENLFLLAQTF